MLVILWSVLAGLLMLIGLVGTVIPGLPDLVLIWVAGLGYGLLVGWGSWGGWLFAGMTVLGLVGVSAEVLTSGAGARIGGASLWSVVAGLAAALILLVITGPLGALIGLLAGVFLIEWWRTRSRSSAGRAVLGTAVGYSASLVVKLTLGLAMIGLWIVWLTAAR